MPEISIVAPVYNQRAQTLRELVRRLSAAVSPITEDFDIVLVDDGSSNDAWPAIADMAGANLRVRGLRLSRNFGQHVAITAGLDHAQGKWVVVMDADLQDRPEVIPQLYTKAQEGYDVVFVNRTRRPVSLLYRGTTAIFYLILNALSGQDYSRLQGNFSIVSAGAVRAFRKLREPGRFYGGIMRWVGFRQTTIDAEQGLPDSGLTSYTVASRFRFAFGLITGFSSRLLYISIAVGLAMAAVSFIMTGFIVVEKLLHPSYPLQGWPSVMTAIFFTAGVTNVAIGLTGIYVGQILQQTKDRPLYVISAATSAGDLPA